MRQNLLNYYLFIILYLFSFKGQIYVKKMENQKLLIFDWVASKKNDIAADHLAFLIGQFPDDPDMDIYMNREGTKKAVMDFLKTNYQNFEVNLIFSLLFFKFYI